MVGQAFKDLWTSTWQGDTSPCAVCRLQTDHIPKQTDSHAGANLTLPKLEKLGFDPSWFSGAVTSGDITHQNLEQRPDSWWQQLGNRCLHLSWGERGAVPLTGLNLQVRP